MYYMPFGSLFIVCSSDVGPLAACCLYFCAFFPFVVVATICGIYFGISLHPRNDSNKQ